jgi:hypothetical protein
MLGRVVVERPLSSDLVGGYFANLAAAVLSFLAQ